MIEKRSNWAGNLTYSAARLHYPTTIEQIQALVNRGSKLKVLGTGHSFNAIADTPADLICLSHFEPPVEFDHTRRTVTIGGGVTYGQLCPQLQQEGYALPNLASLPHISVVGAVATATHGSGNHNGNLATSIAALEIITADGKLVQLSRNQDGEQFEGAVVALGGLGVVTRLTLDLVPAFEMRQDVYENLPLAQLVDHFDDIVASAYSVSLLTDWQNEQITQVWLKRPITPDLTFDLAAEFFGAKLATTQRHPIAYLSAENCTEQLGIPGHWYTRLPHFRMGFKPSNGEELQSEYLIPRQHAVAALQAIASLRDQLAPLLQVSEMRTIAADGLWMSPCYQQACVAFHFTWKKDWEAVRLLLPQIEAQLAPFNARPHWGKLFTLPAPYVQSCYVRLPDFQRLLQTYDPQGKFRNPFLDTYIFGKF